MLVLESYDNEIGINVTELVEFNEDAYKKALSYFDKFKEKGTIIGDFDDDFWFLDNQNQRKKVNFEIDEILYQTEYKSRNMYTIKEFKNSLKCITIFNLLNKTVYNVTSSLRTFLHLAKNTRYFNKEYIDYKYKEYKDGEYTDSPKSYKSVEVLKFTKDFLNFVDFEGRDFYIEKTSDELRVLNENNSIDRRSNELNRRQLPDLQSVFKFNDIIEEFWHSNSTSKSEKALFYPLYIWWKIGNVVPLRVTEFALTPYDCIEEPTPGEYKLILRRSTLKGSKKKASDFKITHTIEGDYEIFSVPTTLEVVNLIKEYKELTSYYRTNDSLLFCINNHRFNMDNLRGVYRYECDDDYRNNPGSYFDKYTVESLLHKFYLTQVVKKKEMNLLGYHVVEKKGYLRKSDAKKSGFMPLKAKDIALVRPGDLRHFAMINMVLNDTNPLIVKELAGHKDINTTYHYFGNIDEVVDCVTYYKYKSVRDFDPERVIEVSGKNNLSVNKILNHLNIESSNTTEVDNGKCSSKKFYNRQLDDCLIVGCDCEKCDYFIRETHLTTEQRNIRIKLLQDDIKRKGELLGELLKTYAKSKNDASLPEIIKERTLLQTAIANYDQEIKMNGWCESYE